MLSSVSGSGGCQYLEVVENRMLQCRRIIFKTNLKNPQVRRVHAVNHQVIRAISIFLNKSSSSADVGRYIDIAYTTTL
jgi:hypothetical protein